MENWLYAPDCPVGKGAGNEVGSEKGKTLGLARQTALVCIGLCGLVILGSGANLVAKEKESEPFALLMGSCFHGEGFSLPGAKIQVEIQPEEGKHSKVKKWQTVSDNRGEFALRLPAGRHSFLIKASREGFTPLEKTVSFVQDERQDIILKFELDSSKKK